MSKKKPINVAVVGLGRAGWNIHVAQLRDRKDFKIVAVVDPVDERLEQADKELGARGYKTLSALLKDSKDVELVSIATPSVSHGPDSKKALKAGKHVVVEKPMATKVSEADSMIRVAKAARKKLFVHQNQRFAKHYTFMQDIIDSGIIGKVHFIRHAMNGFSRRNDWQTLSKYAGGVLNNTCPHSLDLLLALAGGPATKVMGELRQIASAGDVEDHVKALIKTKTGCTIDLEVTSAVFNAMPIPRYVVAGQYGTLTFTGHNTAELKYFDPKKAPKLVTIDGPATGRKYGNDDKLPWKEKTYDVSTSKDKGNFYDNVYDVLRNRGKMRVTPESVREVIRVIAEIRKGTDFPGKPVVKKSKRTKKKR